MNANVGSLSPAFEEFATQQDRALRNLLAALSGTKVKGKPGPKPKQPQAESNVSQYRAGWEVIGNAIRAVHKRTGQGVRMREILHELQNANNSGGRAHNLTKGTIASYLSTYRDVLWRQVYRGEYLPL